MPARPLPILLDACYLAAAVVAAPSLLRKRRGGLRERLGHVGVAPGKSEKPRVLLHAVSVGEVNLLRALAPMLVSEGVDVVVSATTDTGTARAREVFEGVCPVVRYPLDFSRCVRRFLDALRPDAVCLTELELWPNFLAECGARGVPVAVLNGRLSDRSAPRYARLRPLLGAMFERLAFVAAQDERSAERFVAAGAQPGRVRVLGSMKWDSAPAEADVAGAAALRDAMGIDAEAPLIVAGSTAPDEHALLRDATPEGTQLLCAPRRPEWFDDAAEALPDCARRSRGERGSRSGRFLLDTIGELRAAYALADIAVVGRSFGDLFGSDPMEPAALGKPLVMGPAVADFREPVRALRESGGLIQTARADLAGVLERLVRDKSERRRMGEAARACVLRHQGATRRHADEVHAMLRLVGKPTHRQDSIAAPALAHAGTSA